MNSFAGPTLFPSVSELTRCDTETLYSLSFLWSERGVCAPWQKVIRTVISSDREVADRRAAVCRPVRLIGIDTDQRLVAVETSSLVLARYCPELRSRHAGRSENPQTSVLGLIKASIRTLQWLPLDGRAENSAKSHSLERHPSLNAYLHNLCQQMPRIICLRSRGPPTEILALNPAQFLAHCSSRLSWRRQRPIS